MTGLGAVTVTSTSILRLLQAELEAAVFAQLQDDVGQRLGGESGQRRGDGVGAADPGGEDVELAVRRGSIVAKTVPDGTWTALTVAPGSALPSVSTTVPLKAALVTPWARHQRRQDQTG